MRPLTFALFSPGTIQKKKKNFQGAIDRKKEVKGLSLGDITCLTARWQCHTPWFHGFTFVQKQEASFYIYIACF